MAKAELLKALIHSHFEENSERFYSIALQIAAQEARLGHINVASDIKGLIDKNRNRAKKNVVTLPGFDDMVARVERPYKLTELVSTSRLKNQIGRVLLEYRQRDMLQKHGLTFRRKILLAGPPGTGKTMTASILATELQLPIYVILMDRVVQKYMGETSAKLRQVFEIIREQSGVYLFDEFDAIGGERSKENDVGEMRRVVNTFLQFLENDHSESFIVAATNNIQLLDQALFRRFDDVLMYALPTEDEAKKLLLNTFSTYLSGQKINNLPQNIETLSQAELAQVGRDTIKDAILAGEKTVDLSILTNHLKDKIAFKEQLKA